MCIKVFSVLMLMFTLCHWSLAQGIGISAGLNISSVYIQQSETPNTFYEGYHSIVNPNLSGQYEFQLYQNVGLRLGFGYSGKGYGYQSESSNIYMVGVDEFSEYSKIESKVRLSYLQFTPTLNYNIGIGSKIKLYAMFGPHFSFAFYCTSKTSQSYAYSNPFSSSELTQLNNETIEFGPKGDGLDYIDFGISSGIGISIQRFFMEASFDLGLNNIDTFNDDNFRVSNRTLSIRLGYILI